MIKLILKNRIIKSLLKLLYGIIGELGHRCLFIANIKSEQDWTPVMPRAKTFFGYYDKFPENINGDHIVYHRIDDNDKHWIEIQNKTSKEIIYSKLTNTSNLQLGSRVQWITPHEIAFNTMRNDSAVTCVLNIQNMEESFYDGHLFDSFNKTFYVGLDFNQLTKYQPEYGYDNLKSIKQNIFINKYDNKNVEVIISMNQITDALNIKSNRNEYFPNHIMISPNGNKFIFILRRLTKRERRDFLVLYNFETGTLSYLPNSEFVSHMCWIKEDNRLFGYLEYKGKKGFYLLELIEDFKSFNIKLVTEAISDGHPSMIDDQTILLDTYPNFLRMKKLYVLNLKDSPVIEELGQFYEPFVFDLSKRCDLHPRYDNKGIYIDSNHTGKRQLYFLNHFYER